MKAVLENSFRILLFMAFVAFSVVAVWHSIESDSGTAVFMFLGAAFLSLVFAYLMRFKRFEIKALGITGELWENKQEEAEDVIRRLQKISPALAACSYSALAGIGRFSGAISKEDRYLMAAELTRQLEDVGVPAEEIEVSRKHFDGLMLVDMSTPIWNRIRERLREIESELAKGTKNISSPIKADDPKWLEHVERSRSIQGEIQRLAAARSDIRRGNKDVVDRIRDFLDNSDYFDQDASAAIMDNAENEIQDIQAYIADQEPPKCVTD